MKVGTVGWKYVTLLSQLALCFRLNQNVYVSTEYYYTLCIMKSLSFHIAAVLKLIYTYGVQNRLGIPFNVFLFGQCTCTNR